MENEENFSVFLEMFKGTDCVIVNSVELDQE